MHATPALPLKLIATAVLAIHSRECTMLDVAPRRSADDHARA